MIRAWSMILCIIYSITFCCAQDNLVQQDSMLTEVECLVDVIDQPLALNKTQLRAANTIKDLNPYYNPSWIRQFNHVEIVTIYKGKTRTAVGHNDRLTKEQRLHLSNLDDHTSVTARILYIPENNLSDNEEKEIKFTIPMNPDIDARYPESDELLDTYLQKVVIAHIPERSFKRNQLSTVTFTIDEDGHITEPSILFSTNNPETDSVILQSICNMPAWKPAQYQSGLRVRQEFALNVGSMESCTANLVNTRNHSLPPE